MNATQKKRAAQLLRTLAIIDEQKAETHAVLRKPHERPGNLEQIMWATAQEARELADLLYRPPVIVERKKRQYTYKLTLMNMTTRTVKGANARGAVEAYHKSNPNDPRVYQVYRQDGVMVRDSLWDMRR